MAKKPTGLSIARKNNVFTCKWKRGETYNKGEQFKSVTTKKKAVTTNLTSGVTSKAITVSLSNYYPNTSTGLVNVQFSVRGKKGKVWSAWSSKAFTVEKPNVPKLTVTPDTSLDNRCVFSWETTTSNTDTKMFTDCQYQSMLVADCSVTDGSKLKWENTGTNDWRTATGLSATSSVTIDEGGTIATGSHTRWFRIRSRGPRGASAWKYGKRVYAAPYQMDVKDTTLTKTASGYQAYVNWGGTSNTAYPTDTVAVEYTIVTPDPGMACPAGATPTQGANLAQYGKTNAVSFSIDTTLGADQAMYSRVNSTHLLDTTYGAWKLVDVGPLSTPTFTSVSPNNVTFKATVTATNNSAVTDSFLVIVYRTSDKPSNIATLGVIPSGSTSATVQCPDWTGKTVQFGVYAVVGTATSKTRADGVGSYEVTAQMKSATAWQSVAMPSAPTSVSLSATDVTGSVKVAWNWSWSDADNAIISWADHSDAWQSTDEPSEYTVSNIHAAEWTIAGLETGKVWYVRVRLVHGTGDTAIYGPWSDLAVIDLASAPSIPALALSSGIIPVDGSVSAYWSYVSTDGTGQVYAEITEATVDGNGVNYGVYEVTADTAVKAGKTYYALSGGVYVPQTPGGTENPHNLGWYEIVEKIIATTETAQHITLYAEEQGWNQNETHYLAVRVVSGSGLPSNDWSDPVPVIIAAPLTATISATSLVSTTETVDGETRTFDALTVMPMTLTVLGAGVGGTTTVVIERAADYHIDRPDGTDFNGYEGETIYVESQTGEAAITINREDLIGKLDDGAPYRIVATVEDGIGQSATVTHDFEVRWAHQAVMPTGSVTISDTVALISPTQPVGYAVGDTVDIYRLSVDRPELIVEGGDFGIVYVDPYPAIGKFGGHRLVYKTIDGDYITSSNDIAWLDFGPNQNDLLDVDYSIIDFDGQQIFLKLNLDVSNSWTKDFKETRYLGGSVQGDWNKGYSRSSSVGGLVVSTDDPDTIKLMKALAVWDGICHLRTPDGSSFACDIQVSDEMSHSTAGKAYTVTLEITRVEPEELDGQTYAVWSYEE